LTRLCQQVSQILLQQQPAQACSFDCRAALARFVCLPRFALLDASLFFRGESSLSWFRFVGELEEFADKAAELQKRALFGVGLARRLKKA
jgi:hypothetical protein